MGPISLLVLLLQQPPEGWRGSQAAAELVLTRETVVFASPAKPSSETQAAKRAAIEDLYRRMAPRLRALGLDVVRSDQTLIGWQDPDDREKSGQIHLSPLGDFIGVILVAPRRRSPDLREQPEACALFVSRLERYFERRLGEPNPCE